MKVCCENVEKFSFFSANAVLDESSVSPVYLAAQEGHLQVLQHLVKESGGDLLARAEMEWLPSMLLPRWDVLTVSSG